VFARYLSGFLFYLLKQRDVEVIAEISNYGPLSDWRSGALHSNYAAPVPLCRYGSKSNLNRVSTYHADDDIANISVRGP